MANTETRNSRAPYIIPRAIQLKGGVRVATISAGETWTRRHSTYQILNGGAASRTLVLPSEEDNDGLRFVVRNTGTTDNLVVNDDASSTIATLNPGEWAEVVCESSAWTIAAGSAIGTMSLPDSTYMYWGTGNDLGIVHNGTNSLIESVTGNLIIDNQAATGFTYNDLGTDTSATGWGVRNNSGTDLMVMTADAVLNLDGTLDQDATLIATGTLSDMTLAYNSATGNSYGLQVSNVQTTTARTANGAWGAVIDTTSLAGDLNSVEYVNLLLSLTDGGGTVIHTGIDFADGFDRVMDFSAVSTGNADVYLGANLAEALSFTDSVGTMLALMTTTGAVGLDVNGLIDQDYTSTAAAVLYDASGAINHATANYTGIDLSVAQDTTARTAGAVIGASVDLTSLAGDINNVEYRNIVLGLTDGGGTVVHTGIDFADGFDRVFDFSAVSTGNADVYLGANLAEALSFTDSAGTIMAIMSTTGAVGLDLNGVLDMDYTATAATEFAGIAGVINHATANATGVGVTVQQNTTARTAGTVIGESISTTSLAGDINNVEYVDLQLNLTDGGGTVVHTAIDFADGFDRLLDLSAITTGNAEILLPANQADAWSFADSVGDLLVMTTTTNAHNIQVYDGTTLGRRVGGLAFRSTADSAALTGNTKALFATNQLTVPANFLRQGSVIKIAWKAVATAVTTGGDTLQSEVIIGPTAWADTSDTVLHDSGAVAVSNNDVYAGEMYLVVKTAGATGAIDGTGSFQTFAAAGARSSLDIDGLTVDTTVENVIGLTGVWSTADTGNTAVLEFLTIEVTR